MNIIIVDDDEGTRDSLRICIAAMDYSCRAATDGEEALVMLEQEAADVVVTDIKMPTMNGIELLKVISKQYPQIKVIILSGYADVQNAIDAVNFGAHAFFCKPLNLDDFKKTIKQIEYEWNRPIKETKTPKQLTEEYFKIKKTYESSLNLIQQLLSKSRY